MHPTLRFPGSRSNQLPNHINQRLGEHLCGYLSFISKALSSFNFIHCGSPFFSLNLHWHFLLQSRTIFWLDKHYLNDRPSTLLSLWQPNFWKEEPVHYLLIQIILLAPNLGDEVRILSEVLSPLGWELQDLCSCMPRHSVLTLSCYPYLSAHTEPCSLPLRGLRQSCPPGWKCYPQSYFSSHN